jgi:16S rRNA processing protein RimM
MYYPIAVITSIHGLRGFVKIKVNPIIEQSVRNLKIVFIEIFGEKRKFLVEDYLIDNELYGIKFKNFDSANDSNYLIGSQIFIDDDVVNKDPELEIYFKAIGSQVYFGKKVVGTLTEILNIKDNNLLAVNTFDGDEILIPFNKNFIKDFDLHNQRLTIKNFKQLLN